MAVAAGYLALGVVMLRLVPTIEAATGYAGIGARFFPTIIGTGITALGLALVGDDWREGFAELYVEAAAKLPTDWGAFAWVSASLIEAGLLIERADPTRPMTLNAIGFPGARDARAFEEQAEVRTWTSDVLTEPLEVTGRIKAEVFVSSTAKDTDFVLRVTDVYPDGRSILLVDYPLRARYHEGFDHQKLLVPGHVTKLAWDIGWVSIIFNQGHQVRITIASTGAPYFEPSTQTGGPITHFVTEPGIAAINTIWHDAKHTSRVILPTVK